MLVCLTFKLPLLAPLQRESTEQAAEGPPLTFGAGSGQGGTAATEGAGAQQQPVELAQPPGSSPAAALVAAASAFPDLSRMGPLQLTFVSAQTGSSSSSSGAEGGDKAGSSSGGAMSALFEVTPLRSTPANTEGWCSVPGWPLRCASSRFDGSGGLSMLHA